MITLTGQILSLPENSFTLNDIHIRPICDDFDLWYAVVECQLAPGQEDFVNPAGFSIGRAYLDPENNIPCIILKNKTKIGYIVLRKWSDKSANSWSFYLDKNFQGFGYGKTAAQLAVRILQQANPNTTIKLSTEQTNYPAQRLYRALGFTHTGEMDGNDLVFAYTEVLKHDLFG